MTKKRLIIYVLITFVMTWLYCIAVIYPNVNGSDMATNAILQVLVAGTMFIPAIGVLITRLITKEGFKNCMIKPNIKGNVKIYLLAYFGPTVLTLLGSVVYFLIFPKEFDINCGYVMQTYEAMGMDMSTIPMPIGVLMLVQSLSAILISPIVNFVTCFGEEWAWRGYMVPKMAESMKTLPMLLVSGLIWGLWHAPLTIIGHNYGLGYLGYPFTGILTMCLFCTVLGVFMSYITLKTKSCIPAVLAHGSINGFASAGVAFTFNGGNPFLGPAPSGVIGMIGFIVVAVVLAKKLMKAQAHSLEN